MTSKEIKDTAHTDLSANGWLKELCLQMALLNEQATSEAVEPPRIKRKYVRKEILSNGNSV